MDWVAQLTGLVNSIGGAANNFIPFFNGGPQGNYQPFGPSPSQEGPPVSYGGPGTPAPALNTSALATLGLLIIGGGLAIAYVIKKT